MRLVILSLVIASLSGCTASIPVAPQPPDAPRYPLNRRDPLQPYIELMDIHDDHA